MPGIDADSTYEDARLIDLICDEFESSIRGGRRPRLEDFLSRGAKRLRERLLFELLQVAFAAEMDSTGAISIDKYRRRFADQAETIDDAHKHFMSKPRIRDALKVGEQFGRYTIQAFLGSGNFGSVYLARDTQLERDVALKVLHPDLPDELADSYLQEARTAASIDNLHVCPIYDAGHLDSRRFMCMRLLSGGSLKQLLRQRSRLPAAEAVGIVLDIAKALMAAHARGVIHRDIKPANILFDESESPVITDFGLACRHAGGHEAAFPGHTAIAGSPAYMAPELWTSDHKESSAAQDIFSLGLVLFELLTGDRPVRDEQGRVEPVHANIPLELQSILGKALANEPQARYQQVGELITALDQYSWSKRRSSGRHKPHPILRLLGGAVSLVIVAIAGAAVALILRDGESGADDGSISRQAVRSPASVAQQPFKPHTASQIGVARKMPGQGTFLWMFDTDFGAVGPKREMDISFGNVDRSDFLVAGKWQGGEASYPATVEIGEDVLIWSFDRNGDGKWDRPIVHFGAPGDHPQIADWNGDGVDDLIAVRRGRGHTIDSKDGKWHWLVSVDEGKTLQVDIPFLVVQEGDVPATGNWSQTGGAPQPGIARPNPETGKYDWHFRLDDVAINPRPSVTFGTIDGQPVVGDFDADGISDIAVVEPGEFELIWRFDCNRDGVEDWQHPHGLKGDKLLVGTWRFPESRVRLETGIEIFPTSVVDFPAVADSDSVRFTVSNPGAVPLSLGNVEVITGGFEITRDLSKPRLLTGEEDTFEVAYLGGTAEGVVLFTTNDPNESDFRITLRPPKEAIGSHDLLENVANGRTEFLETTLPQERPIQGSEFGYSIAAAGDLVVVGAPVSNIAGDLSGAAYVYRYDGKGYVQQATLLAEDASPRDLFGASVDVYFDTIVVGASQPNGPGFISIFQQDREQDKQWRQVKRLEFPEVGGGARFGASVAIWADCLVTGAMAHNFHVGNRVATDAGSVFVFQRDKGGSNNWGLVQHLKAANPQPMEHFGYSVDIHRDTIAAGTFRQILTGDEPAAYVFTRQTGGEDPWGNVVTLSPQGQQIDSEVWNIVKLHGDTLAVAPGPAQREKPKPTSVHLFVREPIERDRWWPFRIENPDKNTIQAFGTGIAIKDDERHVLVGGERSTPRGEEGMVALYARPSLVSSEWTLQGILPPGSSSVRPTFGRAIALSRHAILVGDVRSYRQGRSAGAVISFAADAANGE